MSNNLYISYDDLLSVVSRETLDKLPNIDPIATIDEMIEENMKYQDNHSRGYREALRTLKQRLSLNPK